MRGAAFAQQRLDDGMCLHGSPRHRRTGAPVVSDRLEHASKTVSADAPDLRCLPHAGARNAPPERPSEGTPLPRFRSRALLAAALATSSLAAAAPANADLIETDACDDATLTQPFAALGRPAVLQARSRRRRRGLRRRLVVLRRRAPGRRQRAVRRDRRGRRVVVRAPAGGSVTSAPTCVNAAYPSFRFFAKSSGGLLGLAAGPEGRPRLPRPACSGSSRSRSGSVTPSSSWQPVAVDVQPLGGRRGSSSDGEALAVAALHLARLAPGTVDDVYVDPFRRN